MLYYIVYGITRKNRNCLSKPSSVKSRNEAKTAANAVQRLATALL